MGTEIEVHCPPRLDVSLPEHLEGLGGARRDDVGREFPSTKAPLARLTPAVPINCAIGHGPRVCRKCLQRWRLHARDRSAGYGLR